MDILRAGLQDQSLTFNWPLLVFELNEHIYHIDITWILRRPTDYALIDLMRLMPDNKATTKI